MTNTTDEISVCAVETQLHLYSVWFLNQDNASSEVTVTASKHLPAPVFERSDALLQCIRETIDVSCRSVVHVIYRGICAKPPTNEGYG